MNLQVEGKKAKVLAAQAKYWRQLGTSYFDQLAACRAVNPCVFNLIRQELNPQEYEHLDFEYCTHFRPQDKELLLWMRQEKHDRNMQTILKKESRKGAVKSDGREQRREGFRFKGFPKIQ